MMNKTWIRGISILCLWGLPIEIIFAKTVRDVAMKKIATIVIEQNFTEEPTSAMEFYLYGEGDSVDVWKGEDGTHCRMNAIKSEVKAMLECESSNGSSAKALVNCQIHKSKETAQYFYFSSSKKKPAQRHFTLYCRN